MRSRLDFTTPGARAGQVREIRDDGTTFLEGHPFVYKVQVADTDDGPQVVGLEIRSPEGEAVPITPNDLRRIPLARLAHAAMAMRTGEALASIAEPGPSRFRSPETHDGEQPAKRPGRRGHPPEFYAQVAALWRAAHDPGRNWNGTIYAFIGKGMALHTGQQRASTNTVKKWVERARDLDLLTDESPREKG
ncbi:hypothetical protein IU418_18770 [Nocardia farcinica]|uniref:hypothetical protein n=1 Tax=Nocardia farcinica TaxID=37329 RepID=UPI001B3C772A|nr:hypothetical protein [Nocardia farcinica]MBF6539257.1 hypothetical protein [Nocardia farcinica]